MPGTTAHPYRSASRLFRSECLTADRSIMLDRMQAHYIMDVMRLKMGDKVRLFNGYDGEWLATITDTERRRRCLIRVDEQIRPQTAENGPTLLFAPIKKARMETLIEKATELGVSRLMPIRTRRTIIDRIKPERLAATAMEAAEQCERLTLPEIHDLQTLDHMLDHWPAGDPLYVADETGSGRPLLDILRRDAEAAFMIGPEGGFEPEELRRLGDHPAVAKVDLGPRILRAETAGIAVLAGWTIAREARN